ncbi:2EXR domain-containing protein [Fusarium sp. Ph1]|nr:2EXR domain-containing protein [Fusarium sp. Ph1]
MSTSTQQYPKMNNTFHRFVYLPWDIREQIWKFALRPSLPGVHIFKLYKPNTDDGTDKNIDIISCHRHHGFLRLAAPDRKQKSSTRNHNTDVTQNRDNLSTYLIDGGLWTACKESRHVIQRHFGFPKWRSLHDKDPERFRYKAIRKLDMPAIGYFAGKDPYFFTVLPNRDLFILQPQDINMIKPDDISWHARIGARWQGFQGFQHVALEYNKEWEDSLSDFSSPKNEAIIRVLITLGYHAVGDKLWFIDYTLRRRHEVAAESSSSRKRESATFYLEGRRFVEVECSPNGLGNWKYTEIVGGDDVERDASNGNWNSISFVRIVRCALMDSFLDFEESGYGLPRQVGLLACESF